MLLPIIALLLTVFKGPGESWGHLVDTVLVTYTANSFVLVLFTAILTVLIGVSTAWIVSRYQFTGKRLVEWLLIMPLTIPSYITAYAYAGIFDYGGLFSKLLTGLGIEGVKLDIFNIQGLIFILSISLFPYVYVATRAVFLFQSQRLIEASSALRAGYFKTFFRVVLPLARPALFGGVLLVIMEVLNDYGAAKYYGVNTLTTGVFRAWFALEELDTAVALALILLGIVLAFVVLEKWLRGKRSYQLSTKSNVRLTTLKSSRSQNLLFLLLTGIPIVFGFIFPVIQLVLWLTLTWEKTFSVQYFTIALQSVGIALLAAFMTVLIALMIIYFSTWNRLSVLKGLNRIAALGYAIPGAVLAIGVLIPILAMDNWLLKLQGATPSFLLNGTIIALLYAYIIRFLAVSFKPLQANQLKISDSLSESAHSLGSGTLKTFFKIEFPLLRTGIFSAVILVFIDTIKELPLTLILKPYDVNTLAVKAYEYASDELVMESALPALTIIIAGLIPILLFNNLLLKFKNN